MRRSRWKSPSERAAGSGARCFNKHAHGDGPHNFLTDSRKHTIAQVKGQPQPRTPGEAPAQSDGARPPAHTHIQFDENGAAPSGFSSSASSSTLAVQIPVKVTSKMLARAEYQKKLAEDDASSDDEDDASSDDEDDASSDGDDDADALDVIDGESADDAEPERVSSKAKGKAKATSEEMATVAGAKKRRGPAPDPFAGYGDVAE